MNKKLFIQVLVAAAVLFLRAGTVSAQEETGNTKPLELPNFIIEGKEQLNVASGVKQFPEKAFALSKNELDSLNSLEKQQSLLLPQKQLPAKLFYTRHNMGFFRGSFGRFMTPQAEAAYTFDVLGYEIYSNAGFEYSKGHLDKSDYSKGFIRLANDYIAPEKYWLFGGSKTNTQASFSNMNYNLYSVQAPPSRNAADFKLGLSSDGSFEGYNFSTGASFRSLGIRQKDIPASDNALNGFLSIGSHWENIEAGGRAMIDFHTVYGTGIHIMQAEAFGKYVNGDFTVNGAAGIQASRSSLNVERSTISFDGNLTYRINHLLTFKGQLFSGFENNSLFRLFEENPYIYTKAMVDYPYTTNLKGILYYHPVDEFVVTGSVKFGNGKRTPYFEPDSGTGDFLVGYASTQSVEFMAEGDWSISSNDNIVGNITFNHTKLTDLDKELPYESPLRLSLNYRRNWFENFGTFIGLQYVGVRYADAGNKEELEGFINLNVEANYKIIENFSAFLRAENLTNSNIYIWKGYKERGAFITAGILWEF